MPTLPDPIENNFFKFVEDPDCFIFRGQNLVKLIHDRFISSQYHSLEPVNPPVYWKQPSQWVRMVGRFFYEGWKLLFFRNPARDLFFSGSFNRQLVVDNLQHDQYAGKLFEQLGRDRFLFLSKMPFPDDVSERPDYTLLGLTPLFAMFYGLTLLCFGHEIDTFVERISAKNPGLNLSTQQLRKSVRMFYHTYLTYLFLLKIWKPRRVFLLCHYGLPGLVAACKHLGIPAIELQHGQIMRSHRYYYLPVLPEKFVTAFRNPLLPDKIGVYGSYWREILLEGRQFSQDQIFVCGYYLMLPPVCPDALDNGSKTKILITTQPGVQKEILAYLQFLRSRLDPLQWKIIIKAHPSEDCRPYQQLLVKGFIELETNHLYNLLNQVQIHISVYSTVLYEAVRYPISNFTLLAESVAGYCQEILRSGVARLLQPDQLPYLYSPMQDSSSQFFSEFSAENLSSLD